MLARWYMLGCLQNMNITHIWVSLIRCKHDKKYDRSLSSYVKEKGSLAYHRLALELIFKS